MKEKAKKFFKVARVVICIVSIILLVVSVFLNTAMFKILKAEEEESREFFELKVAMAQCYLSGNGGLIGHSDNLYKDYSYSKNCKSSLNEAKWIASQIDLRGQPTNYKGQLKLFNDEFYFRIDNESLQWIIDNKDSSNNSFVMGGDPIELVMYYNQDEQLFIIVLSE